MFRRFAVAAGRVMVWAAWAACAVPAAAGGAPAAAAPAAKALPVVRAVEIRCDTRFDRPPDFRALLAIAPGEPLSEEAVRRSLGNLYATGLFAEVRILRRDEPAGTVAVVALRAQTWVEAVELSGETGLPERVLLRSIEQREGQPLVEDRLLRSVYALQDQLVEKGYFDASVRLEVTPPSAPRVRAVFAVKSGPRATISAVTLDGDVAPLDPAALLEALHNRAGDGYDRHRLRDDVERLRDALTRRGRLEAKVGDPRETYDPASHTIAVALPVELGPEIRVDVEGAKLDRLRKRGLLPFLDEGAYDAALVTQTRERLRAHYQAKGHFRAEVEMNEEVSDGRIDLHVVIDPHARLALREIRFEGNAHFTEAELLPLMSTSASRFLRPGRLISETLREDLANLRSFYALQGYSQAEVGPPRIDVGDQDLVLTLPIVEGPRQRVVTLELRGMTALDPADVRGRLPLSPGGPFHPVLLDDAVKAIEALYEEEGYLETNVTPHLDWDAEHALVDVVLDVREGRRTVVDRVILRGPGRTRPEILRRFAGLDPGGPISRRRLLEAERDLYRLGIFSRVEVEMAPATDPSGRRDVVIRLEEGRRWRLGYGVSYHSDDGPGGLLSLSRANLTGRADRLQLDVRGNERDRRFRLLLDQPVLGRFDLPITYTLFRQEEERDTFTVDDVGLQVALTKDLRRVRLGLVYDYRKVSLSEALDPLSVDRDNRELDLSSLTPTVFIDRRDDPLDPHRGWSTSLQLEYAFPFFTTDASFLKLFWQQTHYADLGRAGVVAASWRLGAIEALKPRADPDPLVPEGLASRLIPVSERFFAGGRTTHRAYERDELGIPGETLLDADGRFVEIGGNGLALLNVDYRFPIRGAFGGTLFADVGNVWADWRDFDPGQLEPGAGLGFRYLSPIGPLRLEVGWKLDREPGEAGAVFFFSFGNPF